MFEIMSLPIWLTLKNFVAKITNTVNYVDDTAIQGGSSAGSYITKSINLANVSKALEIRVAARAVHSIFPAFQGCRL